VDFEVMALEGADEVEESGVEKRLSSSGEEDSADEGEGGFDFGEEVEVEDSGAIGVSRESDGGGAHGAAQVAAGGGLEVEHGGVSRRFLPARAEGATEGGEIFVAVFDH
jgi:hypothetical protein